MIYLKTSEEAFNKMMEERLKNIQELPVIFRDPFYQQIIKELNTHILFMKDEIKKLN